MLVHEHTTRALLWEAKCLGWISDGSIAGQWLGIVSGLQFQDFGFVPERVCISEKAIPDMLKSQLGTHDVLRRNFNDNVIHHSHASLEMDIQAVLGQFLMSSDAIFRV
jgi:hypothetical protein